MKKFKITNLKQNDLLKEYCRYTGIDYEVKSNGFIFVDDKNQYLFDDLQCLVRTLKFPTHSWQTFPHSEKLKNYLKQEKIELIEEIDEDEKWITISNHYEIPEIIIETD